MQLLLVLLIPVFLLALLAIIASIVSSAATYNQAQAVVETAKLGQKVADQNGALIFQNTVLTMLLILAVIAIVALVVYFLRRERRSADKMRQLIPQSTDAWLPGPNAGFRRMSGANSPRLGAGDLNQVLMMTLLARALGDQQPAQLPPTTYSNPVQSSYEPGSQDGWEGW